MSRTIAVITTSRADYSHLYWPLQAIKRDPNINLRLIAIGSHFAPTFGNTADQIHADGFDVDASVECLINSDSDVGMAKTIGVAVQSLADLLGQMRPDLLLLIADRYEMLAPAAVALALRIPIAHIEGGEISEGAIDHAVRNALTMMSHIHFAPTEEAAQRIREMGEEPWRIHCVGAPSLDHLRYSKLPDQDQLDKLLGWRIEQPPCVVAYHPVTMSRDTTYEVDAVFEALELIEQPIAFCFPNADAGSHQIIDRAHRFCRDSANRHVHINLAPITYWALLREAALMVGNSSSGIMEAASLDLPVVNIGMRQQGRLRAPNVIDAAPQTDSIRAAISKANDHHFRESLQGMRNPYGDGRAAERIARVLSDVELNDDLLVKKAPALKQPIHRDSQQPQVTNG